MTRTTIAVLAAALALAACSKAKDKGDGKGDGKTGDPTSDHTAGMSQPAQQPHPKIDGPSVSPTITDSITFVVPKDTAWWGEMAFSCYRAVMNLQPGTNVGEAFEKLSPYVPAAMRAGDINIGSDLAAVGAFDCSGEPCLYVALTMRHPEKIIDVVREMHAGSEPVAVSKDHVTFETQGVAGPRTVHVRVVPIQWGDTVPGDDWSKEAARATHVVFIAGFNGTGGAFDPLPLLADAKTAKDHVKDAEGVLADAHGRCIISLVGPHDFQPGFKLDHARFALAAPPAGKRDALMALLESKRTMDIETELTLSPAAKESDVAAWIDQGRSWIGGIAGPLRAQFAGQPMMDVYMDMFALMGERGFTHDVKDKNVRFSWRTDRVPQSDLDALEKRMQGSLGH